MMIEVKNLFFSYGKRKQKVFDDFSLALDKGSVYGLLGKNGTGKSTLLYLMTGLLRPQAGRVLYKGVDVSMRYPLTLQDMFLVPEEFALPSVSLKRKYYSTLCWQREKKCKPCLTSNTHKHYGYE